VGSSDLGAEAMVEVRWDGLQLMCWGLQKVGWSIHTVRMQ